MRAAAYRRGIRWGLVSGCFTQLGPTLNANLEDTQWRPALYCILTPARPYSELINYRAGRGWRWSVTGFIQCYSDHLRAALAGCWRWSGEGVGRRCVMCGRVGSGRERPSCPS